MSGGKGYLIVSMVKPMLMIVHDHIADSIGKIDNGPNYNEQGKMVQMLLINWANININSPIRRISNLVFEMQIRTLFVLFYINLTNRIIKTSSSFLPYKFFECSIEF